MAGHRQRLLRRVLALHQQQIAVVDAPRRQPNPHVAFLVVNTVIGSILEPRVMGRGLGLSPLIVFVSLVFWGWVFGPVGMFLSVPLTMTIKIALESHADTRWIAVFLGSEADAKQAMQLAAQSAEAPQRA